MTEQITIEGHVNRWIVVPNRSTNSRLWFYAPGFEVYVRGENAAKQFDTLANIAMNEALARHIAPGSLKTAASGYNRHGGQKSPPDAPKQRNLFPNHNDTITGVENE